MTKINTHPELNRIAVKQGLDLPYLVWCILRTDSIVHSLSGHYNKNDARRVCIKLGLNFRLRHWARIWDAGHGIFWGLDESIIHLRSFKRVYKMLADDNAKHVSSADFIAISVHKSHKVRRAELYWSWFYHRGEVTISRETIQDLFNLSPDTQRSYETSLGSRLLIKTNYCHIDAQIYRKNPRNLPSHSYTFKSEKFSDNRVYEREEIAYQLPNTFIARNGDSGVSPVRFAPRRALNVSRMLYGNTHHSYKPQRYVKHEELYNPAMGDSVYIRTYYQRKKRINRIRHYF